ncbi:hypothetical protein [Haloferula sargassicola]|uniref:Uncharacterized protein n=1 Tax=Haloferula sargassicola TaxID=490096 RepID=A0ABP9UXT4_9BACT
MDPAAPLRAAPNGKLGQVAPSCPPGTGAPETKMLYEELEELRACLPAGRTLFHYGKDWYAIQLLRLTLRQPMAVADLKRSCFAALLDKPRVRHWLGSLGKPVLTATDLDLLWPEETEAFRLTIDAFDGWAQTSRGGRQCWNLVLQLNLNTADARWLERHGYASPENDPFTYHWHPVNEGRHRTLAWARIDLDWASGEALIEEIQNDRLRIVQRELHNLEQFGARHRLGDAQGRELAGLREYWHHRLRLARAVWDEAMLSAALDLIVRELGLRRVFYHTPESGARYKGWGADGAPRSVYTTLPRRFCFRLTDEAPRFLRRVARRRKAPRFHLLDLTAGCLPGGGQAETLQGVEQAA